MTEVLIRILLPMSLTGGLFWLLLQLARPLLARLRAGWRKALLLGCAALFLLPLPLLLANGSNRRQAPVAHTLQAAAPTAPVYRAGQALGQSARPTGDAMETPTAPKAAARVPNILAHVYGAGVLLSLALAATRHARLMRRLKAGCTPVEEGPALQQYRAICRQLALSKAPALYHSDAVSAPVLAGLAHSRVILPQRAMTPRQLRFALLHELCHYKNRDLPMKYLMLLVACLHWCNPAAHLLQRQFNDACEQSCDEAVTRYLDAGEGRHYAATLLDFAGPASPALVSAFASPAKRLKARLQRLMRPVKPGRALRTAGAALFCLLASAAVLAGCSLAAGAADSSGASSAVVSSSAPDSSVASLSAPVSALPTPTPQPTTQPESLPTADPAATDAAALPLQNPVPDAEFSARGFSEDGHRGLDLNAPKGTPIYTAGSGTVVESGWHYSYGNYVQIDHGDGLKTLYAHNSENLVEAGQWVEAGEQIAAVGGTGNTTGPQCHVEVWLDDTLVDPRDYIQLPEGL